MKKLFAVLPLIALLFCACTTIQRTHYYEYKNEVVLNALWKEYISKNPHPKIVLRVPGYAKDITQSEMSQYESFYNYIEKKLLMANFSVRDRSLLTTVLGKLGEQSSSYLEIGRRVDTDIIIEVVKYKIDHAEGEHYYEDKNTGAKSPVEKCTDYGAILECRLIVVSKNEVVGFITINEKLPNPSMVFNPQTNQYYWNMTGADVDYLNDKVSGKLIAVLKGEKVENSKSSRTEEIYQ